LALATVDSVHLNRRAGLAKGVAVVTEGGTASGDRVAQDAAQFGGEKGDFKAAEAGALAQRVDAGGKQALVGVDVSNPGNDRLVQQRRLDGSTALGEGLNESVWLNIEGVWAEFCPSGEQRLK
jgi:hypothetical protein